MHAFVAPVLPAARRASRGKVCVVCARPGWRGLRPLFGKGKGGWPWKGKEDDTEEGRDWPWFGKDEKKERGDEEEGSDKDAWKKFLDTMDTIASGRIWKRGAEEKEEETEADEQRAEVVHGLYRPPGETTVMDDKENGEEELKEETRSPVGVVAKLFESLPWPGKKEKPDAADDAERVEPMVPETGEQSGDAGDDDIVELPRTSAGGTDANREVEGAELSQRVVEQEVGSKGASEVPAKNRATPDEADKSQLPNAGPRVVGVPPVKIAAAVDVSSIPQRDVAAIRLIFGSETFFATETLSPPGGLIFRGNLRGEPKATLAKLEERLKARLGDKYTLCLAEGEEDLRPVVVVVPSARDKRPATPRQRIFALACAVMTISTCLARALYANVARPRIRNFYASTTSSPVSAFERILDKSPVSSMAFAIAAVVIVSLLVQRFVAARHKTRIALPYLIPSYQLGSFGAVVQLASPTPSRAALFDIALAGAATLVFTSLALLVVGLRMSTSLSTVIPVPMSLASSSLFIGFLTQQVPQGKILVDYGRAVIGLHPLAVIGANCLTIAALNLLPIRQLDGGRIVSAIYGRKTAMMASRVTLFFLFLASSKTPYLVVFLTAITFGPWPLDRPAKNELTEPSNLRALVGYIFMLLMVGVLLPYPACKFFGTMK